MKEADVVIGKTVFLAEFHISIGGTEEILLVSEYEVDQRGPKSFRIRNKKTQTQRGGLFRNKNYLLTCLQPTALDAVNWAIGNMVYELEEKRASLKRAEARFEECNALVVTWRKENA
jgi:hypothetical protein